MEPWLVLTRTAHYAAAASLAGGAGFLVFIAEPAFRALDPRDAQTAVLRRNVLRLLWASLAVALASGALWLLIEARDMSGQPLAAVFTGDIIGTVLLRTQFGSDWLARLAMAIALVPALLAARRSGALGRGARALAFVLCAALLGALAWAGHAGATPGVEGKVHIVSDILHLLAAGAWLGGLLPLLLLFAQSGRAPALLPVARRATQRFSWLGILSVATLFVTGIINSLVLVGSVPGLLGTPYGQLLLVKIAAFLAMVSVAAVNRQRLTPALLGDAAPAMALRRLRRNVLIETALGLAILAIVGIIGTLPPAEHTEPVWPLPFRLMPAALKPDPATLFAGVMVALGFAALLHAALRRRFGWASAALGLALIIGFAWQPIAKIARPAYPTTYLMPTVAYSAASISMGAHVFVADCALCHGTDGRGGGPAAASLSIKPPDLIKHVPHHKPGDLFWWISTGRGGVMPGFAGTLSEHQRWDVINFLRARAAAAQPASLLPRVTPNPAPPAPDFAFEQNGHQDTLRQALARSAVLLVLYRLPDAAARLQQLAAAETPLAQAGLRLLALPADAAPRTGEAGATLPDFAATSDATTATAYQLFAGPGEPVDCEFLIDRAGLLRARWRDGDAVPPPDRALLLAALHRMARLPLESEAAHVHAH